MAKPSKFAHVVYSTRRFEEMVDWYRAVFEATVAYQNPAFAFLTYANLGDLLVTYERLKEMGVLPYWRIHHGITVSLYYRDPDGNRMEFQVDACSVAEANAYMRTPAFAANPAGVEIDPEILLAQYRSGVPEQQLLSIPVGPASPIPEAHGMN